MNDPSAFDHRPDPEIGRLLREALSGSDEPAFVRRVLARISARRRDSGWEILGAWARPGLIAAGVLLFLAGGWIGRQTAGPPAAAPEGAAAPAGSLDAGTLLATQELPQLDVDLVLLGEQ